MASRAWFERLDKIERPTPRGLAAWEHAVANVKATRVVAFTEAGEPIAEPYIDWPALHAALDASVQRARERVVSR